MRLVLDGIEDRSYKPAHIVRLYGGVPKAISCLTNGDIKKRGSIQVNFRG